MSASIKGENITKIELAKRELVEAVLLYFEDRSPITYYILAYASHEIFRNLAKSNETPTIYDTFSTIINMAEFDKISIQKYGKQYKNILRKDNYAKAKFFFEHDYNNTKHSGKDPNEIITMYWETAPLVMLDSLDILRGLRQFLQAELIVFSLWMLKNAPKLFRLQAQVDLERSLDQFEKQFGKLASKVDCLKMISGIRSSGIEDTMKELRKS